MRNYINSALKILTDIYAKGSYSNRALSSGEVADMTTKLVYGTLERDVEIEYILGKLLTKKPKDRVYYILKIGTYALLHLDNVPAFAIVSECVEVTKMNGFSALSGFVNAVLKKVSSREFVLPKEGTPDYYSVKYSLPKWFINRLFKEYGKDETLIALDSEVSTYECARVNGDTSYQKVLDTLRKGKVDFVETELNCVLVPADNKTVRNLFNDGSITFQALSSIKSAMALSPSKGSKILDLCAAPGGKTVLLAQMSDGIITACDLYSHRIDLINKYASRMRTRGITTVLNDASILREEWIDKFDFVLVDAPCSCFGTFKKHPDVFLQRGESEITKLAACQKQILANAIQYVKKGGYVVYSTCTLFDEENHDVVESVLKGGKAQLAPFEGDLPAVCEMRILPSSGSDGFYIARLKKL